MTAVAFKSAGIEASDADGKAKASAGEERFKRVAGNNVETVPFAFLMFGIAWMAVPVDKASAISTGTLAYTVVRFVYMVSAVTVGLPARMFAWLTANAIVIGTGVYAVVAVAGDTAGNSAAYAAVPLVSVVIAIATLCLVKDYDSGVHTAEEWNGKPAPNSERVYK